MSRRKLRLIELWDGRRELGWWQDGLPTFPFGFAPADLATRRQLRVQGLCPGGHDIAAQVVWRGGREWAGLYRLDLARPKRTPTLAQRRALNSALAARRRCHECGEDVGYYLPTTIRACWTCERINHDPWAQAA